MLLLIILKFKPPDKKGLNPWKWERKDSCPQPTPIHKLSMMSMLWNISTGQLGLAAWLCSRPAAAPLLVSWVRETRKSPWFHSNNWKHQCYQHSSLTKSKTLQLLGGKLTLSQPKPGQILTLITDFFLKLLLLSTSHRNWSCEDAEVCVAIRRLVEIKGGMFWQWGIKVLMCYNFMWESKAC